LQIKVLALGWGTGNFRYLNGGYSSLPTPLSNPNFTPVNYRKHLFILKTIIMKKITISVEFKQWGHGFINIIPSDFKEWDPTVTSSKTFNLDPGDYTITYSTVTGGGGSISITDDTGAELASNDLAAGMDTGNFRLTI